MITRGAILAVGVLGVAACGRLCFDDGAVAPTDAAGAADAAPPVTIQVSIQRSTDDAEQYADGTMSFDSSDLELCDDLSGGQPNQTVGLRFEGLGIPAGAQILSAHVQFSVHEFPAGAAGAPRIRGQAADDAAPFEATAFNLTVRPTTIAEILWSQTLWTVDGERGPAQRTPDLTAIVAEIVGRGGWAAGNALVFLLSGAGTNQASSFDNGPASIPTLEVRYAP